MDKPPFDPAGRSFWLIASIIWVIPDRSGWCRQCLWLKSVDTSHVCDPSGKLGDLLAAGLAAALALAGVRGGKDK